MHAWFTRIYQDPSMTVMIVMDGHGYRYGKKANAWYPPCFKSEYFNYQMLYDLLNCKCEFAVIIWPILKNSVCLCKHAFIVYLYRLFLINLTHTAPWYNNIVITSFASENKAAEVTQKCKHGRNFTVMAWIVHNKFFYETEIVGGDATPYKDGIFKLQIDLPNRYSFSVLTNRNCFISKSHH